MVMQKLIALLAEHADVEPESVTADTTFESLGIDSLDTVELLMQLEEELDIEIELDERVSTVGELAAFVEKKMGE
jgi:acyl carrier protein